MRILSLIVLTFVVVIGISFSLLNSEMVTLHYYIGSERIPLSILLLVVWIFGILVGSLATYPKIFRLKMELRRLRIQD